MPLSTVLVSRYVHSIAGLGLREEPAKCHLLRTAFVLITDEELVPAHNKAALVLRDIYFRYDMVISYMYS